MKIEAMRELLKRSVPTKRYNHSVAVYETALKLAQIYGLDENKVAVSALLHDCGREIPSRENLDKAAQLGIKVDEVEKNQPILLHAKLGVYYAQHKYGVEDKEILEGIRYHTTGAAHMSKLAMVVYLADMIEPARDFPGVDQLRQLAKEDLERALFEGLAQTVRYLLDGELLIHPDCIEGYNELAIKYKHAKQNR
jgi:predicted HD superfamily hydrolase involved in NAD metabolism